MGNGQTGNEAVSWKILLTPTSKTLLSEVRDTRIRKSLIERIDGLSKDPDKQGKTLIGELNRFRSLRAVGQRYRIIYRLDNDKIIVTIVALGLRKEGDKADIYKLTKKLLKLGLLD